MGDGFIKVQDGEPNNRQISNWDTRNTMTKEDRESLLLYLQSDRDRHVVDNSLAHQEPMEHMNSNHEGYAAADEGVGDYYEYVWGMHDQHDLLPQSIEEGRNPMMSDRMDMVLDETYFGLITEIEILVIALFLLC